MLLIILGACLLLILWGARFCYRLVFYNVNEIANDVFADPPGKQYEAVSDILNENIVNAKYIDLFNRLIIYEK